MLGLVEGKLAEVWPSEKGTIRVAWTVGVGSAIHVMLSLRNAHIHIDLISLYKMVYIYIYLMHKYGLSPIKTLAWADRVKLAKSGSQG